MDQWMSTLATATILSRHAFCMIPAKTARGVGSRSSVAISGKETTVGHFASSISSVSPSR
jgi:hypothetical protein